MFFSQTRGEWWKTRLVFLATSPLTLALLREVRAAWPLIESAAEWETSSLRMKDEKSSAIRMGSGQQPFRATGCSSQPPLSSPFPPRRPTKWRTRRHKKRPRRESTPLMGVFLATGESRKSRFVPTSRVRPRGLRHSARRPWRQRRCPRRSLRPHRRGRVRRGARVARFRGRAPREQAKRCAFRRR